MNDKASLRWFGLAVLLIALAAAWPELSQPGLLNTRGGGDSPFLLQRLHQLETAVFDGHFPVRWMPDANYGYGYPFYNFYAPLSIYITFLFRLLGFSFVRAIHLSHFLGYLVAAWGSFALARRWFASPWAGLLAAAAYTLAPFHLVNVYVRGDSLAEFWAMAFYPLVILAAEGLIGGGRRQVALFGLAYAGLILSHNISALIFSPFLLLYLLLRLIFPMSFSQKTESDRITKDWLSPSILKLLAGILLSLALAAWFFVPALAEQSLAQLDTVTSGYFHYSNHFLGTAVQPLAQATFFFDYSVVDREAFRMGLGQTAAIGLGVLGLVWLWVRQRRQVSNPAIFILLTLLVSSFMLTPVSEWLWHTLPLLAFTQFPWRFLSVQAFAGALAVGALGVTLPKPQWIGPLLIGLMLLSSLGRLDPDHLPLTDRDVTAETLAQYEWFTGNIGTTISFEYLPPTVKPRPYTSAWLNDDDRWQVRALAGELLSTTLIDWRTTRQHWVVETAVPSSLVFPTLHWPGWEAEVDGEAWESQPSDGAGLITVELPPGRHEVTLRLGRTPVRLLAEWISLAALVLTVALLNPRGFWLDQNVGVAAAALLGLALLVRLWPETTLPQDLHTWDFVQMGYLHPAASSIAYSSGAVLESYRLPQADLRPAQPFQISFQWQVPPEANVTLALYSPAVNWTGDLSLAPPPIVAQTQPGGSAETVFILSLPPNAPAGLFVPRLSVANGRPLTPSGSSRDVLFLQPVRVRPALAQLKEEDRLSVEAITARQTAPDRLEVQVAWWSTRALSQDYNVALRLTDAEGRFLRLVDLQPGYGFLPSSRWPVETWVNDWLAVPLPPQEEGHALPFALVAQLYPVTNPDLPVLTRRLGELVPAEEGLVFRPTEPEFVLPEEMVPETAVFGEQIQLAGYTFEQTSDTIELSLIWQTLADNLTDYVRFVHLVDAQAGGPPLTQLDSPPRYGSYPTGQWVKGEVVQESISLSLAELPPGNYRLAVGFYAQPAPGQFDQLAVQSGAGEMMGEGRFILPVEVRVAP